VKTVAKIVSVAQMRAIEQAADASGLTYDQMMQNAGQSVAQAVRERFGPLSGKRIALLIGSGNNGGDGLVAGYHLARDGAEIIAYLTKPREEADVNFKRLKDMGVLLASAREDQRGRVLMKMMETADVVIDAVLGTGFELPLKGTAKQVLARAKGALEKARPRPIVVAVDCPSGLDCDSGEVAPEVIAADLTVTLAAAKPGLFRFPGAQYTGEVVIGDIGLKPGFELLEQVKLEMAEGAMVGALLPPRPLNAHKGTFGTLMVVAGSVNYPGAAGLAGLGAYRVGAGLVVMAVPSVIQDLLAPALPEAVWLLLPHDLGVINEDAAEILADHLPRASAMVLGPGFGLEEVTEDFLAAFLGARHHVAHFGLLPEEAGPAGEEAGMPTMVVDADGLKLVARLEKWWDLLPKPSVLTPHPGEMALISGMAKDEIQADRVTAARSMAERWGHVVVLKGAFTVIAGPDGRATLIPVATPALARAGTGDVLAGAIGGLLAQGLEPYDAAVAGAYLHARAGQLVAEELGGTASVLAGEVAHALPDALIEVGYTL
jgi:NAD(P)H-hydrate epimerase